MSGLVDWCAQLARHQHSLEVDGRRVWRRLVRTRASADVDCGCREAGGGCSLSTRPGRARFDAHWHGVTAALGVVLGFQCTAAALQTGSWLTLAQSWDGDGGCHGCRGPAATDQLARQGHSNREAVVETSRPRSRCGPWCRAGQCFGLLPPSGPDASLDEHAGRRLRWPADLLAQALKAPDDRIDAAEAEWKQHVLRCRRSCSGAPPWRSPRH